MLRICTISGPYLRAIHAWELDSRRRNLYFARHISPDGVPASRIIVDGPFNACGAACRGSYAAKWSRMRPRAERVYFFFRQRDTIR